jgi:hypothetical protein
MAFMKVATMSGMPMAKTTLRLPEELWRELRIMAVRQGTTAQDLVIRALTAYVKKQPKTGREVE